MELPMNLLFNNSYIHLLLLPFTILLEV